jgi:23S rRNA A1618 N6-methylase RlmF
MRDPVLTKEKVPSVLNKSKEWTGESIKWLTSKVREKSDLQKRSKRIKRNKKRFATKRQVNERQKGITDHVQWITTDDAQNKCVLEQQI